MDHDNTNRDMQADITVPQNIELEKEELAIANRIKDSFYDMMFACPDDLPQLVRGDSIKRLYVYLTIDSIRRWCLINGEKK